MQRDVLFKCEECGKRLAAPEVAVDRCTTCVRCATTLLVPPVAVAFDCPKCSAPLGGSDAVAGGWFQCPECEKEIRVPDVPGSARTIARPVRHGTAEAGGVPIISVDAGDDTLDNLFAKNEPETGHHRARVPRMILLVELGLAALAIGVIFVLLDLRDPAVKAQLDEWDTLTNQSPREVQEHADPAPDVEPLPVVPDETGRPAIARSLPPYVSPSTGSRDPVVSVPVAPPDAPVPTNAAVVEADLPVEPAVEPGGAAATGGATVVAPDRTPALPGRLQQFRSVYERTLGGIHERYAALRQGLLDRYAGELQALQAKLQQQGDLDGWEAAGKEIARLADDPDSLADVTAVPHAAVQALVRKYLLADVLNARAEAGEVQNLVSKYVGYVGDHQTTLTKAGHIETARVASAEIKRVQNSPEMQSARFLLAEAVEEGQPVGAEPAVAVPPPAEALDDGKDAGTAAAVGGSAFAEAGPVLHQGSIPPVDPAYEYTRLVLRAVRLPRFHRSYALTVEVGKDEDVSESKTTHAGVTTDVREKVARHRVRCRIKPTNQSEAFGETTAVLQYFTYAPGEAETGGAPEQLAVEYLTLPRLDKDGAVIDFSVFTLASVARRISGEAYRRETSEGSVFYGLVFSIFRRDGALVYRGASSAALEQRGITRLPPSS